MRAGLISKSQLMMYLSCPRQYSFKYIEKAQVPILEENKALEEGLKYHELFDKFFEKISLKELCKHKDPRDYMKSLLPKDEVTEMFIRREHIRLQKYGVKYFKPLFRELRIELDKIGIMGIIDRVDIVYDKNSHEVDYLVLDYKPSFHPNYLGNLRKELAFYTYLINRSKLLPKDVKYWGVYGYRTGKTFIEETNPWTLTNVTKLIEKFKKCTDEDLKKKKVSRLCDYCEYVHYCFEEQLNESQTLFDDIDYSVLGE